MKKKTKYIILGCVVVISLITSFINQPVITQKKIYHNTTHHEKDINMVMDEAIKEFKYITSKIYSVYYDENRSLKYELAYMKEKDYQEVIIVYLEFKTEFFSAPLNLARIIILTIMLIFLKKTTMEHGNI